MKVNDIRPEELSLEYQHLRSIDIQKIISQKENFVYIKCPACNSSNNTFKFEKDGFDFVECSHCKTLYINPRPPVDLLHDFYLKAPSFKLWNEKIFPLTERVRREKIFKPRAEKLIELCKKHQCKNEILLDVGAGYGTFCEEVKKLNFFSRVIAVEPSIDLAHSISKKNIEVINKLIEDVDYEDLKGEISVICNFELIEHLFNPQEFIMNCKKHLSIGGLLVITTPNIQGFDLLVLRELSENIGGPNHLNYFHPTSIRILFENCGLETIEILTPGKLDADLVRRKILSKEFNIDNNPFFQKIFIEDWEKLGDAFQTFLAENCLSSHMWAVAKKIS